MIHADQLSKEFGRFQAVKNASFQIEKGEIVGFLGPNGAGKTTTLRMLTGYLPPTSGTATIAGFDIVKNPLEARKHLGYLPEHVPLYDDQRVTEYLKFRARLKGISSKQIWPAVSKVVEQCGLDPVRRIVCSKQLFREALNHPFDEPKQWEIREVNDIMNHCVTGWHYFFQSPDVPGIRHVLPFGKYFALHASCRGIIVSFSFVVVIKQAGNRGTPVIDQWQSSGFF